MHNPKSGRPLISAANRVLLALAGLAALSGSAAAGPVLGLHLQAGTEGGGITPMFGVSVGYEVPVGPVLLGVKAQGDDVFIIFSGDLLAYARVPLGPVSASVGGGVGVIASMPGARDYWSLLFGLQTTLTPGLDARLEVLPSFWDWTVSEPSWNWPFVRVNLGLELLF